MTLQNLWRTAVRPYADLGIAINPITPQFQESHSRIFAAIFRSKTKNCIVKHRRSILFLFLEHRNQQKNNQSVALLLIDFKILDSIAYFKKSIYLIVLFTKLALENQLNLL